MITERIRRPKDKEPVLQQLVGDGPFAQLRDVLVFAAALGHYHNRRLPFADTSESIRWDVAIHRRGTEALVNMLGVAGAGQDPEILADEHFSKRREAFEEYANGGLQVLQEHLNREHGTPTEIVIRLIERALASDHQTDSEAAPDLGELADQLVWPTSDPRSA